MTICNLFGRREIHTDEDYKRLLLRRQRFYIVLMLLGLTTMAIAFLAEFLAWNVTLSANALGFYCGAGTGATFATIVFLIRTRRMMKNPEAIRKARIKETDERILEIGRHAAVVAGYVLLIVLYLVCLIGGLFYPELLMILAGLISVFLLAYSVSFAIYNKRM